MTTSKTKSDGKMDIFYVFFVFLACSFIGWIFETVGAAFSTHQFTGRGYLFVLQPLPYYFPSLYGVPVLQNIPLVVGLPLIEIYGFGGVIAIFGLRKRSDHPVWLFLAGIVILTLFELLGSYFCSYVLHREFWNYSDRFLNFQGRICLTSSLAWGFGSLIAVKGLNPLTKRMYREIRTRRVFKMIVSALMIGALICALSKYWWFADLLT